MSARADYLPLDDRERRFFEVLLDITSPTFGDVEATSRVVFGSPEAGVVLMSSPTGRAWRRRARTHRLR